MNVISLSLNIFLYKSNDFTKHHHALCHRSYSLRCDSKTSMDFFLLLHNFTERRLIPTIDLSNLSIRLFLLSCKLSPFQQKETLYSFSLA